MTITMAQESPLYLLKQSTLELVSQNLRSHSAVIARLAELIARAVERGVSHRSIYETLVAGGLTTTWTNYRIALGRARKAGRPAYADVDLGHRASATAPFSGGRSTGSERDHAQSSKASLSTLSQVREAHEPPPQGLPYGGLSVMDALQQARDIAQSKDYGQIARDLYRQQQRDRRIKDRS